MKKVIFCFVAIFALSLGNIQAGFLYDFGSVKCLYSFDPQKIERTTQTAILPAYATNFLLSADTYSNGDYHSPAHSSSTLFANGTQIGKAESFSTGQPNSQSVLVSSYLPNKYAEFYIYAFATGVGVTATAGAFISW